MVNLKDFEFGDYIKALFIGEQGSGKTTAAASWPGRTYFFCWDGANRMLPIRKLFPEKVDQGLIEFDFYDFRSVIKAGKKLEEFSKKCPYDNVVWDSFTFFADNLIEYSQEHRQGSARMRIGEIKIPEMEDYNVEASAISDLIQVIKSIQSNFIMTGHLITTEKKILGSDVVQKETTLITASKKNAVKVPGLFNEVWHFEQEESLRASDPPKRVIYTEGKPLTKTALPLPGKIDYTGVPLYDKIEGLLKPKGLSLNKNQVTGAK